MTLDNKIYFKCLTAAAAEIRKQDGRDKSLGTASEQVPPVPPRFRPDTNEQGYWL